MPNSINAVRLKQLIKEKFKSNAAFARACGVSRQYITEVLSGRLDPSLSTVMTFASTLGVTVDELLVWGNRE